jgi:4-hydroxyproline epimerase
VTTASPTPRVRVVDSHTEGEPTRVVISGAPDLGSGTIAERRRLFAERFDRFRSAIVNEPRGSEPLVGALLLQPVNPRAAAAVVFFNNVGVLNGCGHGTIGLVVTLAHLGRISEGSHIIETPVGDVTAHLAGRNHVRIENVPSYRASASVDVHIEWAGRKRRVRGDVAWGGNWFFLTDDHDLALTAGNIEELTAFAWALRQALGRAGVRGDNGSEIDHVELFAPPSRPDRDSRNFVLCPGKAYDRSPCGTGTSAKIACLAADGKLREGQPWIQESIIGSTFTASYRRDGNRIIPAIAGTAYITAEADLLLDPADPFVEGIRP